MNDTTDQRKQWTIDRIGSVPYDHKPVIKIERTVWLGDQERHVTETIELDVAQAGAVVEILTEWLSTHPEDGTDECPTCHQSGCDVFDDSCAMAEPGAAPAAEWE